MIKIGIISDTHGFLHPKTFDFFKDCNEIWHAGDIGSTELVEKLQGFRTTRAVWGNIDDYKIKLRLPEVNVFRIEEIKVLIMHIAGRPGKYSLAARNAICEHKPDLLIAGHSHILQVKYDQTNRLLFVNPGAAGIQGFHQKITFLRLTISGKEISDLEIFETDRNSISSNTIG